MKKISLFTYLISYGISIANSSEQPLSVKDIYEKASKHVLKIDVTEIYSGYGQESNSTGTGFWLGGDTSLIATNAHIASPKRVAKYEAVDLDGSRFPLKLVYTNPIIDLAYLMPAEKKITQPTSTYEFCTKVSKNSNVYMIGNNGGHGIVQQDGKVSDTLSIKSTDYPRKSIMVSINGKGGSSGSMVINESGQIIGVNYGGGDVAQLVIPAEFVIEDLIHLKKGSIPPKKDIGLTFGHISADEAQKYYNFNLESPEDYNAQFMEARSRLLIVFRCLNGSDATRHFKPGDIITKVENQPIGPDLFKYHNTINNHQNDTIKITFQRKGKEMEADVKLYDLNEKIMPEFIIFGKAVHAVTGPAESFYTGIPLGSIALLQNPSGNIYSDYLTCIDDSANNRSIAALFIKGINDSEINNLDDIEKIIPELTENPYFSFIYEDHSNAYQLSQSGFTQYDHEDHQTPIRMKYNWSEMKWDKKEIK